MAESRAVTILIIDDDRSVRTTVSIILARSGFVIFEADSADEARKLWADLKQNIDVLLVDVMLPIMSGPDLVRELIKDHPNLPVIFATGMSANQAAALSKNIQGATVLTKPFRPKELIETVNRLMAGTMQAPHR